MELSNNDLRLITQALIIFGLDEDMPKEVRNHLAILYFKIATELIKKEKS